MTDKLKVALAGMAVAGFINAAQAQEYKSLVVPVRESPERVAEIISCIADVLKNKLPEMASDIDLAAQINPYETDDERWRKSFSMVMVAGNLDPEGTDYCLQDRAP
ncbi:MAG: hypothetical protein LRY54_01270 [Alphaproteobacteria bacterium]|nr:hypothetical protein [Alphaproteobacteria bacterium]